MDNNGFLNITGAEQWHAMGYKGQGITVMVAENTPSSYHSNSVVELVKTYAPLCNVILFDHDQYDEAEMIDFAIANNIDIINTSYGSSYNGSSYYIERAKTAYAKAFEHGIIIVNSAGNESGDIKDNGTIDTRIINVGAIERDLNVASYSNYDNISTIDCGGMVGYKLEDGSYLSGTSEASPCVSGLIACLFSKEMLTLNQLLLFIGKYAIDLPEDNKTGAGLFRLPSFTNPYAVKMKNKFYVTRYVHKDYVYEKINENGYTY